MRRVFALTPAYLLLACIFKMDEEHFRIMHYLVPFCASLLVYDTYQKKQDLFFSLFLITIVLYNPVIPTEYYMQSGWMFFDLAFGVVFIVKVFMWGKIEPDKVSDKEIRRSSRRIMAIRNAAIYKIDNCNKEDDWD
jgi:hypothetical protein